MKAYFISVGSVYLAKVSDKIARVRVDRKAERFRANGQSRTIYHCTNLDTGRTIIVKSAQRFRGPVNPNKPQLPMPDLQVPPALGDPEPAKPTIDPPAPDATDANVGAANRNDGDYVQDRVTGLVRRYGSNLRNWSEFHTIVRTAGLEPKDVTDERLAAASLKLHDDDEGWRQRMKENNENPVNLRVVFKGDPEFDPLFPTTKENDMAKKKTPAVQLPKDTKIKVAPKPTPTPKPDKSVKQGGKMSALDAAAKVLAEEKRPMKPKELIAAMEAKGYWTSPGGKTPDATLSAAIGTEIKKKGADSRFAKAGPGQFTLQK